MKRKPDASGVRTLAADQDKVIAALRNPAIAISAIANEYGVSPASVTRFAEAQGIDLKDAYARKRGRRPDSRIAERNQEWLRLATEEGYSFKAIGDKYGVTGEIVRQSLKPLGLPSYRESMAQYKIAIAQQVAPLYAEGMSKEAIAAGLKTPLPDIVAVLASAREFPRLFPQLAQALKSRDRLESSSHRKQEAVARRRQEIVRDTFAIYRQIGAKMRDISELVGISYTVVVPLLEGKRPVTSRSWDLLATAMPVLGRCPATIEEADQVRTLALRAAKAELALEKSRRDTMAKAVALTFRLSSQERKKSFWIDVEASKCASLVAWELVEGSIGRSLGPYPLTDFIQIDLHRRLFVRSLLTKLPSITVRLIVDYLDLSAHVARGLLEGDLAVPYGIWQRLKSIAPEMPDWPETLEAASLLATTVDEVVNKAIASDRERRKTLVIWCLGEGPNPTVDKARLAHLAVAAKSLGDRNCVSFCTTLSPRDITSQNPEWTPPALEAAVKHAAATMYGEQKR